MSLQADSEFTDLITHFTASQTTLCAPDPSLWIFPSHIYLSTCMRVTHRQPYLWAQTENCPTNPLSAQSWCFRICFESLAHFPGSKRASAESSGQTHSHFIAFRTNPVFRALTWPNCKAAFPYQQIMPRGSCWGTLHLFTPFLRLPETRHRLDSPPLALPSPPPRDMKTVQVHRAWAKQINSLIRNVKFYAVSLFAMIILMQSSHEQAILKEKFMQSTTLHFGRVW